MTTNPKPQKCTCKLDGRRYQVVDSDCPIHGTCTCMGVYDAENTGICEVCKKLTRHSKDTPTELTDLAEGIENTLNMWLDRSSRECVQELMSRFKVERNKALTEFAAEVKEQLSVHYNDPDDDGLSGYESWQNEVIDRFTDVVDKTLKDRLENHE